MTMRLIETSLQSLPLNIVEALRQLGARYGISLNLSDANTCRLIFGSNTVVDIETTDPQSTSVVLHGLVGVVPLGGREPVYELLLEANLFGRGTSGSVLALDVEQNEIILHRTLDLRAMTFGELKDVVETFAAEVKGWTERLVRPPSAETAAVQVDDTFVRV